ncbi:hypothetical protein DT019_38070 [Streptomyces sp. SDr-06]|nr:hypothetical protein DT019_38070 [Streptomyces sp. SDr-06]
MDADGAEGEDGHRPDYPPKTPPPPKKPVEPPRPEGAAPGAVLIRPRLAARIANRRAANWTLENAPWSPAKAGRHVIGKLAEWGYRLDAAREANITEVTVLLARAALSDGGRRISLHLADQDHQALILILSHQSGHTPEGPEGEDLLRQVTARGVVSCGTDTDQDDGGRRRWALADLDG